MPEPTARPQRADIRRRAADLRAAHGALAAELLDLERNGEARLLRRRGLAKVLREVRRLDRQEQTRLARRGMSHCDLLVLGLAAAALVAAVYLVIRG